MALTAIQVIFTIHTPMHAVYTLRSLAHTIDIHDWVKYLAQGHTTWRSWGSTQWPHDTWTTLSSSRDTAAPTSHTLYIKDLCLFNSVPHIKSASRLLLTSCVHFFSSCHDNIVGHHFTCVSSPICLCGISWWFYQEPPRSTSGAQGGRRRWLANRSWTRSAPKRSYSHSTGQTGNLQLRRHRIQIRTETGGKPETKYQREVEALRIIYWDSQICSTNPGRGCRQT